MTKAIRHLQGEFQDFLFSGRNERQLLPQIAASNNIPAQLRLEVYRNAYYIRLQEAIAHDFPTLLAVAGDAHFGELTSRFIKANPSTHPSLRDFGRVLPQWLREEGESVLADVAELEWAVVEAFDAADKESLDADILAQIPPNDWEHLIFDFHPSVSLVTVSCNARECWSAVRNGEDKIPALEPDADEHLVVWRAAKGPSMQVIEAAIHRVFTLLMSGSSFGKCCLELSQVTTEEQTPRIAAQTLALACSMGCIVGIDRGVQK